ncbi:hypothetical protein SBOR_0173 [Sclerotinia borealis F-4128]|uniref:Uncharacterized protein n=1 Tax=Sclerotinia borealis (strain F-4128) TaxID=1432307 RepID=W9CU61_SCLBF|nr:hypothetical protein SBOR_0173 [Sclerotinia borealis F-4128]
MPPKTIFLTGAPTTHSLNWDETQLLHTFTEPFIQFLHLPPPPPPPTSPPAPHINPYPNSAPPRNNTENYTNNNTNTESINLSTPATSTSTPNPTWRQLPLSRQHLATGVSQDHAYQPLYSCNYNYSYNYKNGNGNGNGNYANDFFSTTTFIALSQGKSQSQSLSLNQDSDFSVEYSHDHNHDDDHDLQPIDAILSQFYEHSYAIHADIPSSQIGPSTSISNTDPSTSISTSFSSPYNSPSLISPSQPQPDPLIPLPLSIPLTLTPLSHIPPAQHLLSLHPQTITLNLITGIISISPLRTITTKRGDTISLIELLVGDETKSGFGITFWLSNPSHKPNENNNKTNPPTLETTTPLSHLRTQDTILLKNIALGTFRGKVHGQSLRRDMTKCWLMYREKIDRRDVGGFYGERDVDANVDVQLAKVKRVRDWVRGFVGVAHHVDASRSRYRCGGDVGGGREREREREVLPPDTQ